MSMFVWFLIASQCLAQAPTAKNLVATPAHREWLLKGGDSLSNSNSSVVYSLVDTFNWGKAKKNWTKLSESLVNSLKDGGVVRITNHGMGALITELFQQSALFFRISKQEKQELRVLDRPMTKAYRGYLDIGEERLNPNMDPDKKETFDFAMPILPIAWSYDEETTLIGPNKWPFSYELRSFKRVCLEFLRAMHTFSVELLRAIITGLHLPPTAFDSFMDEPLVVTRLLKYPPQWAPNATGGTGQRAERLKSMGASSHVDYGFLTLLVEDKQGLEVMDTNSQWKGVPHVRGSLIVNTGFVLEKLTNGILPATRHRVINRHDEDRLALAFFLDPDPDATIGPLPQFVSENEPAKYKSCVAGHKGVKFGDPRYKKLQKERNM